MCIKQFSHSPFRNHLGTSGCLNRKPSSTVSALFYSVHHQTRARCSSGCSPNAWRYEKRMLLGKAGFIHKSTVRNGFDFAIVYLRDLTLEWEWLRYLKELIDVIWFDETVWWWHHTTRRHPKPLLEVHLGHSTLYTLGQVGSHEPYIPSCTINTGNSYSYILYTIGFEGGYTLSRPSSGWPIHFGNRQWGNRWLNG